MTRHVRGIARSTGCSRGRRTGFPNGRFPDVFRTCARKASEASHIAARSDAEILYNDSGAAPHANWRNVGGSVVSSNARSHCLSASSSAPLNERLAHPLVVCQVSVTSGGGVAPKGSQNVRPASAPRLATRRSYPDLRQVHPALAFREQHVRNAVALSRQMQEHVVAPVLHRRDGAFQKAEHVVERRPPFEDAGAVRARDVSALPFLVIARRALREVDANVGQRGTGASKKCTGKLLVMPPSENQPRSGFFTSGCCP